MSVPPLTTNIGNVPERFAYVSSEINALYAGSVFKGNDGGTQLDQRITAKKSFGDALGTTGKIEIDPLDTSPSITFYNTALNTTNKLTNSNIVITNTPNNSSLSLSGGNITANNSGLNNNPVLSLNQGGSGNAILYEEMYNQRTAQTGEFNRMSFYAKNNAGTKTEYARIHQNAPQITAGATRGRIDFALNTGSGLTDYLSLNSQTQQIDILGGADIDMNTNEIVNCSTIFTPSNNTYSKESNNIIILKVELARVLKII